MWTKKKHINYQGIQKQAGQHETSGSPCKCLRQVSNGKETNEGSKGPTYVSSAMDIYPY